MAVPIIDDSGAYWISPDGKILTVGQTHIREVLDNPAAFGTTPEELEAAYKKFGEKNGIEGKARGEIMTALLERGWIRIRYHDRRDAYSIELNTLSTKRKDYLWAWASGLLQVNNKRKYSEVQITELGYNTSVYSVQDLVNDVHLNFQELNRKVRGLLVPIKSSEEFLR
jgi:hypothetical protein